MKEMFQTNQQQKGHTSIVHGFKPTHCDKKASHRKQRFLY